MTSVDRIQGLSGSLAVKAPVRAATTAAITLSGEQTVDGVAVAEGDRVLVKNQASSVDNGIYDVSSGGWTRSLDFDGSNDVVDGTLVVVTGGTNANLFSVSATNPVIPGTSAITILADRSFGQDGLPTTEVFDGGGSAFVLAQAAEVLANVELYISGVCQRPTTDFTYDNGTLTVTTTSATPAGTGNVMIRYNRLRAVGALEVTTLNKITLTQPANGATLTILDGKTLTVNHSLTLTGTDGTTMTFPATSATLARIDAANTFAGLQTFGAGLTVSGAAFNSRGITDSATAKALTLSGSGANSVTIANAATNPTIGTSAGDLILAPGANTALVLANIASAANYLYVQPGVLANENVVLRPAGAATNCALVLSSKGSGGIALDTGTATLIQVLVQHTASADRYITLTGSNGGNPTIGTSAGALQLAAAGDAVALCVSVASAVNLVQLQSSGTGTPVYVYPSGASSDANVDMVLGSKGTGAVRLLTGGALTEQVRITHTASADRYITLTGSNGGNPTIGTSGGGLRIAPATGFADISGTGNAGLTISAAAASVALVSLYVNSAETARIASSADGMTFATGASAVSQVVITHTASSNRYITLTGSNGGNPTIGTSAGNLNLSSAVNCLDNLAVGADDALGAGGVGSKGLFLSSSSIAVIAGSGAPTISAAKGSLYLRSDGTATNNRMYVNTDGATTWTAVTTVA